MARRAIMRNNLKLAWSDRSTLLRDLVKKYPDFDPTWPNRVKAQWFSGFVKLIELIRTKFDLVVIAEKAWAIIRSLLRL